MVTTERLTSNSSRAGVLVFSVAHELQPVDNTSFDTRGTQAHPRYTNREGRGWPDATSTKTTNERRPQDTDKRQDKRAFSHKCRHALGNLQETHIHHWMFCWRKIWMITGTWMEKENCQMHGQASQDSFY